MELWEIIKELQKFPEMTDYEEEKFICHPHRYYEAVRRGIIADNGKFKKGFCILDVLSIQIPIPASGAPKNPGEQR